MPLHRLRALRPRLSPRYQHLRRPSSTLSPTPPQPTPSFLARHRAPLALASLALALGLTSGALVSHIIAPPPHPEPGSHGDALLLADLNARLDAEFKIKVLRGKCLGVTKALRGVEGGWVEIIGPGSANGESEGEGEGQGARSLASSLQGAKGLGVERLFYDRGEHMLVAVVWFGASLSGWPGVTHGGVIATALSDKLALTASLAAMAGKKGKNGSSVSAAAIPQRLPGTGDHAKMFAPGVKGPEPAHMRLSYVKPTLANGFYVIRVQPSLGLEEEAGGEGAGSEVKGGRDYEATLETLDGKVCATAQATFAAGGVLQRVEEGVGEGVGTGYAEFREWMWPSRQRDSRVG
ncbi:hypothetical protein LTR08_000616 [Meristemomyces frigidus]|nr:hypothetical protein LTR08_000616 [Meristemomyces frigidus]